MILTNGAKGELLCDEIRNAVSDAFGCPGNWSIRTSPIAASRMPDGFARRYTRRANPSLVLASILDTRFDAAQLVVRRTPDGLALENDGRLCPLQPVSSGRFVVPDAHALGHPAARLDRESDQRVSHDRLIADEAVLVSDRAPPGPSP